MSALVQVLISKDKHVAGRVKEHLEVLEAEVTMLRDLNHPNIVRYLVRHLHSCFSMRMGPLAVADTRHSSVWVTGYAGQCLAS